MFNASLCRWRRALRLGEECERLFGHREERRPVLPLEGKSISFSPETENNEALPHCVLCFYSVYLEMISTY